MKLISVMFGCAIISICEILAQPIDFENKRSESALIIEKALVLINDDCDCNIILQKEMDSLSLNAEIMNRLFKDISIKSDTFSCFKGFILQKSDFTSKRIKLKDNRGINKVQKRNRKPDPEKIEIAKLLKDCRIMRVHQVSNVCKVNDSTYILKVNRGTQNNTRMICYYIIKLDEAGKARIVGREDCNVT
ncbi:MAG: hypothetical protein M3Q58_01155 [Bacteroidota bacterium]|nr:hypothetical protein [Bacteroidota bacterium]